MALQKLRRPENVDGDFYVDSSCIDCDLCRQIAPQTFASAGEQSAVYKQPDTSALEFQALKALVTCPTASIGTVSKRSAREAAAVYPERIDEEVHFCGFASESSFGASSYLIVRPEQGNILVDSPRFASSLVRRTEELGGIRTILLTHRDDVADHEKWAKHFGAARVMHADDAGRLRPKLEQVLEGDNPISLEENLLAIPTPGHTRGHMVFLYRNRYLFSGDHLWWSERYESLYASRSVCWYSWPEQVRSVEKLLSYNFEWVLPGHGRRAQGSAAAMRESLIKFLNRFGNAVSASHESAN